MDLQRLSTRQFEAFSNLIYKQSGIRIDEKKVTLLSNRIRRRLRALDHTDFDDYFRFLTSNAGEEELGKFLDAITTNETFFFRTEKHFDWLESDWLPAIIDEHRSSRRSASLRIWSAGCATGAEPYSIAIKLLENSHRLRDWSLEVLATDISDEALESAKEGCFAPRAVESVSERQRRRFFQYDSESDRWCVKPEVKRLVTFRRHNLMEPSSERNFDCIFIRNVLIYFDRASKRVVLGNLLSTLASDGYLVVGPSEGVYDLLHGMHKVTPLIYQKRKSGTSDRLRSSSEATQ